MKTFFIYAISLMFIIVGFLYIYNAHRRAVAERANERLYRERQALKSHIWGDSVMHHLNGEYYKIDNGPWIKKGGMLIQGEGKTVDSIRHQLKHK